MENRRPIPRLCDEPFPPYAFVPGQHPHPISDPAGHRFGRRNPSLTGFEPSKWRRCRPYLYGIDLFNGGYYWEAHEAWEIVWVALSRAGLHADFVKGLIKLAAAGVKGLEGNPLGVRGHALRAAELFSVCAQSSRTLMGFDCHWLRERALDMVALGTIDFALAVLSDSDEDVS